MHWPPRPNISVLHVIRITARVTARLRPKPLTHEVKQGTVVRKASGKTAMRQPTDKLVASLWFSATNWGSIAHTLRNKVFARKLHTSSAKSKRFCDFLGAI